MSLPPSQPPQPPNPNKWTAHKSSDGRTYYFNRATDVSQWKEPTGFGEGTSSDTAVADVVAQDNVVGSSSQSHQLVDHVEQIDKVEDIDDIEIIRDVDEDENDDDDEEEEEEDDEDEGESDEEQVLPDQSS